jgi:hypothetical protein
MRGRRRVWLAVGSTLSGFALVWTAAQPAVADTATTLVNEPFTGTTTSSTWVLPDASTTSASNDACLSADGASTSATPVPGCTDAGSQAGLQLTTAKTNQEGGLAYSSSVPTSQGLDVRFDSYQYAGTGADGILFFLAASNPTNATESPVTLGPFGGHLGYSTDQSTSTPGLTNGYLGFGLDAYGNFTNGAYAGSDCQETQAAAPDSVVVRGPGNDTDGYCLLQSDPLGDSTLRSADAQDVPVEVAINPTSRTVTTPSGITVAAGTYAFEVSPIGGDPVTETGSLPDDTYLPDGWGTNGVPDQLTFGWAASTGAQTDYHTISNVNVDTLTGTPSTLSVLLQDDSNGAAQSGDTVHYDATVSIADADETQQITLTDTFPAQLVPQTPILGASGWNCGVTGQTVSCTHPPAGVGKLSTIEIPVHVNIPPGPSLSVPDTATVGAPDATQGSDTDTQTYAPAPVAPSATVLSFVTQPVDVQVNTTMTNADSSTTHIRVAADLTSGGAVDTTYTGNVTLGFGTNPSGAQFVVGGSPASSITVPAVNGVADFSPIIINATGFGYTLQAMAAGLTSATSNTFNVVAAATTCPSGKTCTVTTTSPSTGINAAIVAGSGSGTAVITATFGGNVAPIHPCTGATAGILTFSGNRQKTITLTIPIKQASPVFCYGQPTPFIDFFWHKTTYFSQANHEYEGILPFCVKNFTGPCVKSITLTKTTEKVVILSNAADPRAMR